jgi:galactokinase
MVGGGFGGSAIAVVDPAKSGEIIGRAAPLYKEATGLDGAFHVVAPGDGARVASG